MSKFYFSGEAKSDLMQIYQYGKHQFGTLQADNYFEKLFEHFDLITHNPFAFQAVGFIKKGYRRCPCGSHNIYYRINDNEIEIMAIIGRQDIQNINLQ